MRDQRRAEDDDRDRDRNRDRDRDRDRIERRHRSPVSSRRGPASDRELKARGGEIADTSLSRFKPSLRDRSLERGRSGTHRSLRSHPRENKAGLREFKRSRILSEERSSEWYRRQQESLPPNKRQRTRSVSSDGDHHRKLKRRASRSPKRSDRSERVPSRHRARANSPRRSPGRKYLSRHHDRPTSPDCPTLDSYVPSSYRRRSRSPAPTKVRRSSPSRRLSRSPGRKEKPRHEASPQHHSNSSRLSPKRDRKSSTTRSQRTPPSRRVSPKRIRDSALSRRRSPSNSRPPSHRSRPSRRSSRSPNPPRISRRREADMQSTKPIQSILEQESRPPSPPRPIPSFDADNPGSVNDDTHMREAFPMHGMKATDMQSTPRPPRPNIDTRQTFSTSPQYITPNSSHHGSPQSGSPFGNSRGGWGGQQQQFHGQHG